jgi:glycosyltransferase involved in cell wall biosynthesis
MKIAIFMSTYNGERFILDQLDSILNQTYVDWTLHISDDRSTDKTLEIVNSWIEKNSFQGKVKIYCGPKLGFANNFLSLTVNQEIEADLFFWADQDDIWLADKIERTIGFFQDKDPASPILYCGRTILVDADNVQYGLSPLQNKFPPSFGNALVQSLAGGNTMAFNAKARELIGLAFKSDIPSHDWWAYLIVIGNGGTVFYDPKPTIRYRQHGHNMIGSNLTLKAKFQRFIILANGFYKARMDKNIKVLLANKRFLSDSNSMILNKFLELRKSKNIFKKILALNNLKIRRQHTSLTIALTVAFLLKRL